MKREDLMLAINAKILMALVDAGVQDPLGEFLKMVGLGKFA